MSREYNLYPRDILEAIGRIDRYTRGMGHEEFLTDDLVQDGVIRNLMVIGEAKLIPEPLMRTRRYFLEKDCRDAGYPHSRILRDP